MYDNSFDIAVEPFDMDTVKDRYRFGWVKWLILFFAIAMPVLIFTFVQTGLRLICIVACANLIMISYTAWRCLRIGTLASVVPVMFLPYITAAWPISMLYFAFFYTNAAFYGEEAPVWFFFSGLKVQGALFVFLFSYLGTVLFALRNEEKSSGGLLTNPRSLAIVTMSASISIVLLHATARIFNIAPFLKIYYVANVLFNYFWGLLFLAGSFIKAVPVIIRIVLMGFLGMAMFFYTVGNARGQALYPVTTFIFGILLFSDCSRKTKLIIVLCVLIAFPMYVMISNTTRILTQSIGWEDFFYRLNALREWRSVTAGQSAAATTLHRLFFSGGHAIITRTPGDVPYRAFRLAFIAEMARSLLPAALYYNLYWRGTAVLLDYGFHITEYSSTEVSIVGGFWVLGGWPAVAVGGFAVGLLHWWLISILRRNWQKSKMKAFVYFSVYVPVLLWGPNYQPIDYWRVTIYAMGFAFIVYQALRLLIGDRGRGIQQEELEEVYPSPGEII
jgi:hypothetical protein